MAILRTGFVALLLVCAANASQPLESERDQYKAPHPPQLLSEATDQTVDAHHGIHSFVKPLRTQVNHPPSRTPQEKLHPSNDKKRHQEAPKDNSEDLRQRRSIGFTGSNRFASQYFNPWSPSGAILSVPPLSSFSIWQPQTYQISRPYFIPIWGSSGRIPLYFPPQPLYINTGYPVDNPPRGYLPPTKEDNRPNNGYLPPSPDTTTAAPDNSTTMPTDTRFYDPDHPVWDSVPGPTTTTVGPPTRRTRPPGQRPTTHPPLVHNGGSGGSAGNQLSAATTTTRPSANSGFGQRPSTEQRPPAPIAHSPPEDQQQNGKQPSRCVWAIISCCSTSTKEVSYSCFEQLGCSGAFWDTSPCDSEFARAAIANVMDYYTSSNSK